MDFDWNKFSHDLKACRVRRKLGLRECCRSMPVNHSTWSRAENGKPIEAPSLVFLCEWMNRHPRTYAMQAARPR